MSRRLLAVLATLSLLLIAPPVQAAPSKPRVSLSASTTSPNVGTQVRFEGVIRNGRAGAKAVLQRRQGSASWSNIRTTKLTHARKVSFVVKVREGRFAYRLAVGRTKRSRSAVSRPVVVTGRTRSVVPGSVLLSGTPTVGQVLRSRVSGWRPTSTTFTYQWFRDGTPITSATEADHLLTPADVGRRVSVEVIGAAPARRRAARSSSAPLVRAASFGKSLAPSVFGEARVGAWLTAGVGDWGPDPSSFSFQWWRSGSQIPGATSQLHRLTSADLGEVLWFEVTASLEGYETETRVSPPTEPVTLSEFSATPSPTVAGQPHWGSRLVASSNGWSPTPTSWTHQWLRDGDAIVGATDGSYVITSADLGHRLSVRSTGHRSGYTSVTRTSAQTSPVIDTRPTAEQVIQRILADTNTFRAQNHLPALKLNSAMNTVAGSYAQRMHDTCTFEHNPDYAKQIPGGWTRAAENIAAGYDYTAVVQGWIDSPGHRANLLGDFTHIGIGSHQGLSCHRTYFVQNFAKY